MQVPPQMENICMKSIVAPEDSSSTVGAFAMRISIPSGMTRDPAFIVPIGGQETVCKYTSGQQRESYKYRHRH